MNKSIISALILAVLGFYLFSGGDEPQPEIEEDVQIFATDNEEEEPVEEEKPREVAAIEQKPVKEEVQPLSNPEPESEEKEPEITQTPEVEEFDRKLAKMKDGFGKQVQKLLERPVPTGDRVFRKRNKRGFHEQRVTKNGETVDILTDIRGNLRSVQIKDKNGDRTFRRYPRKKDKDGSESVSMAKANGEFYSVKVNKNGQWQEARFRSDGDLHRIRYGDDGKVKYRRRLYPNGQWHEIR